MVRKQKTVSSLNRSAQIKSPSAHITPHITPPLSSGTLPLGESGCIPEQPPFIKATPAPTHSTFQSTNPAQNTPSPPSSSAPRPRARFKPEKVPTAFTFPRPPSDLGSEGWSTEEEDRISESSGDFNPYSDPDEYNLPWQQGNILFNDLATELNTIVDGLNDSNDEYGPQLRLRETYINMMQDYHSTYSLGNLQTAVAHLLSQLLEEGLFVPTPDSRNALRGLMASMLIHRHLNLNLDDVATGEDPRFPLSPDCVLMRPSTHHHYGANPPQLSPHVSGTAEETVSNSDKKSLNHVTISRDQQNKRSKHRRQRGKPTNK